MQTANVLESFLVHYIHLIQLLECTFLERRLHKVQNVVNMMFLWSTVTVAHCQHVVYIDGQSIHLQGRNRAVKLNIPV